MIGQLGRAKVEAERTLCGVLIYVRGLATISGLDISGKLG
jgi:hypothetical protein